MAAEVLQLRRFRSAVGWMHSVRGVLGGTVWQKLTMQLGRSSAPRRPQRENRDWYGFESTNLAGFVKTQTWTAQVQLGRVVITEVTEQIRDCMVPS